MNVISTAHWYRESSVAFFFHRTQKIARIGSTVEPAFGDPGRIEAAFESKTRFLGRIINRANNEIFTGVPARTPPQSLIFVSQTLDNSRPRNVGQRCRQDRH